MLLIGRPAQENLINLTPKKNVNRVPHPPTIFSNGMIFLITVILLPGAVLVTGISHLDSAP
jgi:hypothetical protein